MFNKIIFVTGVNGVGKSTVITPLKAILDDRYIIYDFDERGVPDNVTGQWRREETAHWIRQGYENITKGLHTIICGFAKPSEIYDKSIGIVHLDVNEETIKQRLWSRYQTPESIEFLERKAGKTVQKFIDDNAYMSRKMREKAQQYNAVIIDTVGITPQQVAERIAHIISPIDWEV